jgi:hypothetical protein
MVAYHINGRYVNNIYLALHESWKTGGEIKFYCFDYEFDQHNWSQEPTETIYELMSRHAKNLRNRYERLVLLWSGGTDSHTIYNVFNLNRIHIDEILVGSNTGNFTQVGMHPEDNATWLRKNHWDPTTTITHYNNHDTELRSMNVTDENWIWADKGDLLKYETISTGNAVEEMLQRHHSGHSWCAIAGYEKPRLIYRNGTWHHRQLGMVFHPAMGYNYIEHFFLEPQIAIKQAHMVKRGVKNLLKVTGDPLWENDWAEAKWPWTPAGYHAWATSCGRDHELSFGTSFEQKTGNIDFDKTELNFETDWRQLAFTTDKRLQQDLSNGHAVATSFVKGFYNLTQEFGFRQWMEDNGWFRANNRCFTDLKFIWSKEYNLGA